MSAKVVLEKGRGWSAVDELVLWGLSRKPMSATSLSDEIDLPRRVVLEVIIRMMRFRLVEAVLVEGTPAFQATEYGSQVVSSGSEIPTSKQRMSRNVAFVTDLITDTVFARADVKTETGAALKIYRDRGVDVRDVEVTGIALKTTPKENAIRFQKVLRRDETFLFFDGDTAVEHGSEYIIATVDGEDIRGLPAKAPRPLLDQILMVARSNQKSRPILVESLIPSDEGPALPPLIPVLVNHDDFIFGDDAHRKAFAAVIGAASRRVFLHSTFLRSNGFLKWKEEIKAAVQRGARFEIFWGSGTAEDPNEKTFSEATALAGEIAKDKVLKGRVRIHLRSTGSHSKLLIADDGKGGYVALIGSCNWLYTGFNRLELSFRCRDPRLVANGLDLLAGLVARPGFRPEIGTELYILSKNLRSRTTDDGPHGVRLLNGGSHEAVLREASGSAPSRFIIASDKLGNSVFPNAIIPAEVAAATARTVPVVIYGDTTGLVGPAEMPTLVHDAQGRGVRLLRISQGFHAKFLLWGDDDLILTSLNWCSWSTNPDAPRGEIGIHIHRNGIARDTELKLKMVWPEL
jgi:hypothetical protein